MPVYNCNANILLCVDYCEVQFSCTCHVYNVSQQTTKSIWNIFNRGELQLNIFSVFIQPYLHISTNFRLFVRISLRHLSHPKFYQFNIQFIMKFTNFVKLIYVIWQRKLNTTFGSCNANYYILYYKMSTVGRCTCLQSPSDVCHCDINRFLRHCRAAHFSCTVCFNLSSIDIVNGVL